MNTSAELPVSTIERFAGRLPVHSMRRVRMADRSFRYAFVSPSVADSFGLDPKALEAARAVDHGWIHSDDRARFVAALHRSGDTLTPLDEEVRVTVEGHGVRWVRSLGDPVRQPDGSVIWDGAALDVTDRRLAQARMEDAIEAAKSAEIATSSGSLAAALERPLRQLAEALWPTSGPVDVAAARLVCEALLTAHGIERAADTRLASPLTRRQAEIAHLIGQGLSNQEVAAQLDLTEGTVKVHVTRIFKRLGARNRTELALRFAS